MVEAQREDAVDADKLSKESAAPAEVNLKKELFLLIPKDLSMPELDRLWVIQLFEAYYNFLLRFIWYGAHKSIVLICQHKGYN